MNCQRRSETGSPALASAASAVHHWRKGAWGVSDAAAVRGAARARAAAGEGRKRSSASAGSARFQRRTPPMAPVNGLPPRGPSRLETATGAGMSGVRVPQRWGMPS